MVTEKLDTRRPEEAVEPLPSPGAHFARTASLEAVVTRNRYVNAIRQQHSQRPPPLSVERVMQTARARTLVVVDDDRDLVDLTVMILETAGHTAHGATNALHAVDLVVASNADIMLLDYMMPNMTGGDVGKAVRARTDLGQIKIVMMSATPEAVVRAEFDQYDAFMQKPVDPDGLLRMVEDLGKLNP